jgi:hypothetical protein
VGGAQDLDVFFVDDFDESWASDETYSSADPGASYWIHNDCNNLRICYEESGHSTADFTGNGVAFVYPVALPSMRNYRDGHTMMPAALELYNISHGHRGDDGARCPRRSRRCIAAHCMHACHARTQHAQHPGHARIINNIHVLTRVPSSANVLN